MTCVAGLGIGMMQGAEGGVSTVVRADPRSGRLVRSVVVVPKSVTPKVISPQPADRPAEVPGKPGREAVQEIVERVARTYEVDPLLVHSVIEVESSYRPDAVSPKGAQGLMQLIPATARRFGVKDSFDVQENIEGGVRYLKYLQTLYNNDMRLALAAYNAGEGAVSKYGWIPPYPETQKYVYQVGKKLGEARRAAETKKAKPAAVQPPKPPVEEHRPVEQFVDAEGKLYLRTR